MKEKTYNVIRWATLQTTDIPDPTVVVHLDSQTEDIANYELCQVL